MSKNPKLRKNGGEGTELGNFLRSINFKDVGSVVASVLSGDIKSAIETLSNSDQISEEELKMALKKLEMDVVEMQEVTKRWVSDNQTDSYMTKNIRPLTLGFLTATLFVYIILDSSLEGFSVDDEWIGLLKGLMMLTYGGYFGVRSAEKIVDRIKGK
jgi:hypothetical protein